MRKIKRINITGFRGIKDSIDISLEGKSAVIFGKNSYGKSSLVDSVEWLLSEEHRIESLSREGAGPQSYPHIASPEEVSVEIEFQDLRPLKKTYSYSTPTRPELSDIADFDTIQDSYSVKPYLRYGDIAKFVLSTKTEKYQYLAALMGFEPLVAYQQKLNSVEKTLIANQDALIRFAESKENEIFSIIDKEASEENLLKYINEVVVNKHKKPKINDVKELGAYVEDSKQKLTGDKAVMLQAIERSKAAIKELDISEYIGLKLFNDFLRDVNSFKDKTDEGDILTKARLYEIGMHLLTGEDHTQCPLCDHEWHSKEALIKVVREKITSMEGLTEERDRITTSLSGVKDEVSIAKEQVSSVIRTVSELEFIQEDVDMKSLKEAEEGLQEIEGWLSHNEKIFEKEKPSFDWRDKLKDAKGELKQIEDKIKEKEKELGLTSRDKEYQEEIFELERILSLWESIREAKSEAEFKEKEIGKFSLIKEKIYEEIRLDIKQRFETISELVNSYFKILRPDQDNIEEISIEFVEGADRSAEIEVEFYDISVSPPYKVFSESMLNSLGLSIYLACVQTYNDSCKFIILDDVINSLDVSHRNNLSTLFQLHFSDHQLIILTHDSIWFRRLRNKFNEWMGIKIKKWEFDTGPLINYSKTTKEDIDLLLDDPTKVNDAGGKLRVHIEGVLHEVCERIQAQTPHQHFTESPYVLSVLLEALIRRLKDKGARSTAVKFIQAKDDFQFVLNFCSHNNDNYASEFDASDIKDIADDWFELEEMLFCNQCNSFVSFRKSSSSHEHIDCDCGEQIVETS